MVLPADTPFHYEEPLPPDELIDRAEELSMLGERAQAGRNTLAVAPRRYGKTSLLRRLLRDLSREGVVGAYVDLYGVLSVADVATRIELAYADALDGALRRWFSGLRRTLHPVSRVSAGPAALELGPSAGEADDSRALLERLATPRRLHERHGQRVLVVFDEFQALLRAGAQLDATFRSEIQHHGDAVAYVFAGSHPGMMRELFAARERPFFGQAAPLSLGPLADADLAEHIGATFERTGRSCEEVLDALLKLAQGHPQRSMQLASHLWSHTPMGARAGAEEWAQTLATVGGEMEEAFCIRWDDLPRTQQQALSAIAIDDGPLLARSTRQRQGTTPGATPAAVRRLLDAGDVVGDERALTGHRVVDPLFARWIREGRRWGV